MGTSGKVVSNSEVSVLVEVNGKLVRSKSNIRGMIVLDEPTYNLIWKQWQERQKNEN
jgi:hypothetical protein